MLTVSGSKLSNHWFGLQFEYKSASKTTAFSWNGTKIACKAKELYYDDLFYIHVAYDFSV